MSGSQVLRWQIPVDDADHELVFAGAVPADLPDAEPLRPAVVTTASCLTPLGDWLVNP